MASKETEEAVKEATEGPEEVIEPDSEDENSDNFEDASDSAADGGTHDFDRPEEWGDCSDRVGEGSDKVNDAEEEEKDSSGAVKGSPDYVDEALLQSWEGQLGVEELEQKRLEGVGYKLEGNSLYLEGKTLEACDKYTAGLRVCPLRFTQDRAVLYANRGQMKRVLELPDQAVSNCTQAIKLNPAYLKALLRRAEIYEETDKLDEALKDFQSVLELDPRHVEANKAIRRLPGKIEERNEKMKAEMFDNLKKLGNMCLNPFGLSTENFKMEQDPSTGSYNIQFQQNK